MNLKLRNLVVTRLNKKIIIMKHIRKFNESKSITHMLLSQSKEELEEAYFYLEPYDGRD